VTSVAPSGGSRWTGTRPAGLVGLFESDAEGERCSVQMEAG